MSHVALMETRRERWTRRLVTIPLYTALWAVSVVGLPLWLALAIASDVVRRVPAVATRCVLFFVLYLCCEMAGILVSALLWRPGRSDERGIQRLYALQQRWAGTLFCGAQRIFSFRLEIEGEDAVGRGPLLVLIRHASTADTPLPVVLLHVRHGLRMRYVLKRELLWDPCLDLVGQRLPNVFVRRGSRNAAGEAALVASLGRDLGVDDGVLIYPEGSRFSPAKLERAVATLAAHGEPARHARAARFRRVLPPRPAGVLALLDAAPAADVLMIAHTGFESSASFTEFWNGGLIGRTIRVRMWRVPRQEIPIAPTARVEWLDAEWARIDSWLREGDTLPESSSETRCAVAV